MGHDTAPRRRLTAGLRAGLALLFLSLPGLAAAGICEPGRVDLRGDWGTARFSVEVADEPEEQAKGLMFRESLPASAGMIFVYPYPGNATFWMKNTLIPLDMLFIRPDGVVQYVHENAKPRDLTHISGGEGVMAVLEIRGGMAGLLGITAGSELRSPLLPQDIAAWPCEAAGE